MTNEPRCAGCGARIIWAETPKGKRQPFDAKPTDDGTYWLIPRYDGRAPIAEYAAEGSLFTDRLRYVPHHATCPKVEQFRH